MGPGVWEVLVILLVIIIFFVAKKIPELARGLGLGLREFKKVKQPLVLPLSRLSSEIKEFLKSNKVLDFGLEVKAKKFEFKNNYAILPNSLVASYALAIAASGKANRILLAGFDGYPSEDPRRVEMDEKREWKRGV